MVRAATALLLLFIGVWLQAGAALAEARDGFNLGFEALAAQIPDIVGQPVEEEHYGANGDSLQQTTTGLMAWRKADNWTAFTNGTRTWVNGPLGVQERGNEERFDWESPAAARAAEPSRSSLISFSVEDPLQAAESVALDLINRSRQEHGLPPLVKDDGLQQSARGHARDMAARSYFAHNSPEGRAPWDRAGAVGVTFAWLGENMGWGVGFASAADSVRSNHGEMMAELPPQDSHRKIILDTRARRVGIGVALAPDGKILYVSDFAD